VSAEILTASAKRGNEVRMARCLARETIGKPVRKRSEVLLQLVGGRLAGNEVELVEIKTRSAARATESGRCGWIEGTAKNRDAPRMMFAAVRCACTVVNALPGKCGLPERIEAAYDICNSLHDLLLCSWRPPGGQQALTNDDALARPRRFRVTGRRVQSGIRGGRGILSGIGNGPTRSFTPSPATAEME